MQFYSGATGQAGRFSEGFCLRRVHASERLTGALLDRLTHHVHILELNGDSYRLKQSKQRQRRTRSVESSENPSEG
jgi:murein tripeptide amidase MpaA